MLNRQDVRLPLSCAQLEIWLAQQIDPKTSIYNISECVEIHGPVDLDLFETALRQAVSEAESLHVRFVEDDGEPRQVIEPSLEWPLPVIDVSAELDPQAAAEDWMLADSARPLDLTRGPLFSYALFRAGPERFFWYQGYHHIVLDGFGLSLIARRVAEIYTALVNGVPCAQGTSGSVRLLLASDAAYRASDEFVSDRDYWMGRVADRPEPVRLADRCSVPSGGFIRRTVVLPRSGATRLRVAAASADARWGDVVIAATAAYLHRLTGARDVIFGLPVSARPDPVLRDVPGMVSNVLPLRVSVRPDTSLSELMQEVSREVRQALKHQRYRGEDLCRDLKLAVGIGEFVGLKVNIMAFDDDLCFAGHRATVRNLSLGPVDDLSIRVRRRSDGDGLLIDFDANPALYGEEDLEAHQRRFLSVLEAIAGEDPGRPVGRVDVLTPEERRRVLVEWNDTVREVPSASLPVLFEAQVARTPDAVAVVFEDTVLSYAELNGRANRLARYLGGLGVGPEVRVGIALERSVELIVALLAVLKAGGAFVPLEASWPTARVAQVISGAGLGLVLCRA
ncbi:MAG: condensation domain-containing protein, partial [Egibacteraceae bacterium]